MLARARQHKRRSLELKQQQAILEVFKPYTPPPGVLPAGEKPIAMDTAMTTAAIQWAQSSLGAYWTEGLTFMGYAELSNLTVRPEYRVISQVIATECTRKWITFQSSADTEAAEERAEFEAQGGEEQELDENGEPIETEEGGNEEVENGKSDEEDDKENPFAKDASPEEAFMEMQAAKEQKAAAVEAANAEKQDTIIDKMTSKDDKSERIKELTEELERLNVRDVFYKVTEIDGWMGRAHIYIDTSGTPEDEDGDDEAAEDRAAAAATPVRAAAGEIDREELMTDIGDGANETTKLKFKKGSLKRLAVVEPLWTYPQSYNAIDPLREDWYNPSQWFVMGKQLHCSRLLTFVGRPVPDILKPAYGFGGLSLSQICKPYIDNWLQTRQSVNDIIHAFSVMVLQTDLSSVLQVGGGGDTSDLFNRLDVFNQLRDNRGVFAIDKDAEDFKNVSAPLSSLDQLQAQAQEHMAAVSRIPLVKLLGISPHGLNASSEGELKAFYDTISAYQESFLRPNLTKVINFAMMNLWGEVDEDIVFKFEPLEALDAKEEAEVRKIEAETDDILVNGVAALHPVEVRRRIATDPNTPYEDIDVADVPEAPASDTLASKGHQPFAKGAQGEEQAGEEGNSPFGGGEEDAAGAEEGGPSGKLPFGGKDAMPEAISRMFPRIVGDRVGSSPVVAGRARDPRAPPAGPNRQNANHFNEGPSSPRRDHQDPPGRQDGKNVNHINRTRGLGRAPGQANQSVPASISQGILPDKKLSFAQDADWKESDHPRVKGGEHSGEFAAGGGGAASATTEGGSDPSYAGQYVLTGGSPKANHALTVSKVMAKPAQKGIHYRRMLAKLIKEAPGFGGAASVEHLKKKLGDALVMTHSSLMAKGKTDEAAKVAKTLEKMGMAPSMTSAPATAPTPAAPKAAPAPKVASPQPGSAQATAKSAAEVLASLPVAEINAAKKTGPYYPVPASAAGKVTAEEFNKKWATTDVTGDPEKIIQKIVDYKAAKEKIATAEKAAQAELQAKAAEQAKKQAEQEKQKAHEAAAKNAVLMKDLGITEQEAFGFGALAKMMSHSGQSTHDLVEKFKVYEEEAKQYGYPISGFQCALIKNYSNGGYTEINSALRQGTWTEAQHVYVKLVNKAIKAMPAYKGVTRRGTSLNQAEQSKFVVGNIVPQMAFTSTSTGKGWSGNTEFEITAIGKRGSNIKKLSNHPGENEVLFAAMTNFKITKVDGKPGGKMIVHMEEMDDD